MALVDPVGRPSNSATSNKASTAPIMVIGVRLRGAATSGTSYSPVVSSGSLLCSGTAPTPKHTRSPARNAAPPVTADTVITSATRKIDASDSSSNALPSPAPNGGNPANINAESTNSTPIV